MTDNELTHKINNILQAATCLYIVNNNINHIKNLSAIDTNESHSIH